MAVEVLFGFLTEGRCPRPTVELTPHIVMRSNLKHFLETLDFSDSASPVATPPPPEAHSAHPRAKERTTIIGIE
jgi:hypothetical protein